MARTSSSKLRHGAGRATIRRAAKPPYHVVKLGPMDTEEGAASLYIAITDDELLESVVGEDDAAGLAGVVAIAGNGPRTCDAELLEAGAALGFGPGEPPEWAVHAIAAIAARMHNAFTVAAEVPAEAWDDLLDALGGFAWNAPWDMWTDGDRFTVELSIDGAPAQVFDATVMGAAGETFGLALYPGPDGLAKAEAAIEADDVEQMKRVPTISVTLDQEPAWVAAAVEAAYGTAAAPSVLAQDDGGRRMVTATDLHGHAAALSAMTALSPWVSEVTLVRHIPDGPTIRVIARIAVTGN